MQVRIHYFGKAYVIECPAGARVKHTEVGEDCLIYEHNGKKEFGLAPIAVVWAEKGERGLRLVAVEEHACVDASKPQEDG